MHGVPQCQVGGRLGLTGVEDYGGVVCEDVASERDSLGERINGMMTVAKVV